MTSSTEAHQESVEQLASKAAAELAGFHEQLGSGAEQRRFVRSEYSAAGMIAWAESKRIPHVSQFKRVHFQDISSGGVGFRCPVKPEHEQVIVVLRKQDSVIVLRAKVVGCRQDQESGEWVVGCRFTQRIRVMKS